MRKYKFAFKGQLLLGALVAFAGASWVPAVADDTEIYQKTEYSGSSRPKVLIILDTSGSMNAVAQAGGEKPFYDPGETYADAGFDDSKIYWSLNSDKPTLGTNRYFAASSNRCDSSFDPLDDEGTFTTKTRRWRSGGGAFEDVSRWVCNGSRYYFYWCLPSPPGWERETVSQWVGSSGGWRGLSTSDRTPAHVDCQADVLAGGNAGNGTAADGFPYEPGTVDASDADAYKADLPSNIAWGDGTYKWYTAHYLNYWYDDSIVAVEKTRLEVAKEVVNELINTNTSIDFGLAIFNHNTYGVNRGWCINGSGTRYNGWPCSSSSHRRTTIDTDLDNGGRVIQALIEDMTDAEREDMAGFSGLVNSLEAQGNTPLCESTYEAYRYLAGLSEIYGEQQDDTNDQPWNGGDSRVEGPDPDPRAYVGGTNTAGLDTYAAPGSDCSTYIILMTDGAPTRDDHADAAVEALSADDDPCGDYDRDGVPGGSTIHSCLPTLTKYMANNDLDKDPSNGDQFGYTYTIGFATDQPLLEVAAENGEGKYFTAETTEELTRAFQDAVFSILAEASTFTSPAVAVNTFARTETRNEIFYAMFLPDDSQDWKGNIKRLDIARVATGGGEFEVRQIDEAGLRAIDPTTGFIRDLAKTFWGGGVADGPSVDKGGVGALLAASDLSDREDRMWTNTGSGGVLEEFASSNLTADAYGFDISSPLDPLAQLFAFWGVSDQDELDEVIDWAIGYDVDDRDGDLSTADTREWLMADILHSKPTVVSYGARGSFTEAIPDLRILVGTNGGFMHMFGNSDGVEDWAFFPKELGGLLAVRKNNVSGGGRPYGVDSPPVVYSLDVDKDGTLDSTDGDKVWVFFGLRRGGRAMYGMDISDPDNPEMLWSADASMDEFSEMGQTWAIPIITTIPGHLDGDTPKPVVIFGAGYDPNKDNHATLGTENDTMGRGIYIVDAESGDLIWSVTPAVNSATNMQATELLNSIPSQVRAMDSNRDGLTDRIYVGDTGGNVWRIDLAGAAVPTILQDKWRISKLFAANGGTQPTDRRFFAAPEIARVIVGQGGGDPAVEKRADVVFIGSGDRTNPAAVDFSNDLSEEAVQNQFYMIRDLGLNIYETDYVAGDCSSPPLQGDDVRCFHPLTPASLYDASENDIQDASTTAAEKTTAIELLADAQGWLIDLEGEGEKSLSSPLLLQGVIFFETYTPTSSIDGLCTPVVGDAYLYALAYNDATAAIDFDKSGDLITGDRKAFIGNLIPDSPAIHIDGDGVIRIIPAQGKHFGLGESDLINTGAILDRPFGTFWYREEY